VKASIFVSLIEPAVINLFIDWLILKKILLSDPISIAAQALSSSFWKQMEPLFRFISEIDTAFLRQQVKSLLC